MRRSPILATLTLLLASAPLASASSSFGHADRCYEETLMAQRVADASTLSVLSCNRAIKFSNLSSEALSQALHNRGLIELAKGELAAAMASFQRAVATSARVDSRNLALAQLAHKQGDYALAIEQYDLIIEAAAQDGQEGADWVLQSSLEVTLRNRQRAVSALATGTTSIVQHQIEDQAR